ncbi:hypothetical protein [Parvibaculum sp. MBR-TMA-1.3b-4.2]
MPKRAAVQAQGDPLAINTAGREGRKARKAVDKRRADYLRGSVLANLFMRGTLNNAQFKAGGEVRRIVQESGGGMKAIDFTRERVDGSGPQAFGWTPMNGYSEGLDYVRAAIVASGMGVEAGIVVIRIAGLDETVSAVAQDFEDNEAYRRQGAHSRVTRNKVGHLLQSGLDALAGHWYGKAKRYQGINGALQLWLDKAAADAASRKDG